MTTLVSPALTVQHLIDPEVCIRCNTCRDTCPVGAVDFDGTNYVVKPEVCNGCRHCVPPCPTGAIDHWLRIPAGRPHTIAEQFSWEELPPEPAAEAGIGEAVPATTPAVIPATTRAPWSAASPTVGLYTPEAPAAATVTANLRLTDGDSDVHHLTLDFGDIRFPVLEGQSVGVLPPGTDAKGRPHLMRLYSVASPRDGETWGGNDIALTVKRVTRDHQGGPARGLCSNYLCDLAVGDRIMVAGPYGATFLKPNHPGSGLLMICTGTGSASMRGFIERRRRAPLGGPMMLFYGARTPAEMAYAEDFRRLPREQVDLNVAFSRAGGARRYVQDLLRDRHDAVFDLLSGDGHVFVCGLKGMESGVEDAMLDICRRHGADGPEMLRTLRAAGRYQVETY